MSLYQHGSRCAQLIKFKPVLNSGIYRAKISSSSYIGQSNKHSFCKNASIISLVQRRQLASDASIPADLLPPSLTRKQMIEAKLTDIGINPQMFSNDLKSAGTPAVRAFNSFVNMKDVDVELTDSLITRTANQIAFLYRQHRAEVTNYVRNKDKIAQDRLEAGIELNPIVLVLDNVRSANNVGSILRTAETAGVSEVMCCGITPHPPHAKLSKTALGAAESVPTSYFESTHDSIKALKEQGYEVYGMETTSKSVCYTSISFPKKTALVLGNEVIGVDTRILEQCDWLIEIPMFGFKNSLNVSSAASVAVFEVLRQWR